MGIFDAAKTGDVERLAALLAGDKKLANAKGPEERRPLHFAAEHGHVEAVKLLLQHKAKPGAKAGRKTTPLELAVAGGHELVARLLVDAGADLDAFHQPRYAPLHGWLQLGNERAVSLMLELGADANHVMESYGNRRSLLHTLAEAGHAPLTEELRVQFTHQLLEHGADPNMPDEQQRTPLHVAAEQGHWRMMEALLDRGADIEAREASAGTPLHFAVASADLYSVELLLNRGADPGAKADDGRTPLEYARLYWGYRYVAEAIAKKLGREPAAMTRTQPGEFLCACKKGYVDIARRALSDDPHVVHTRGSVGLIDSASPLHLASIFGQGTIAELLLAHGHAVDAVDQWGKTPLMGAAQHGHIDVVDVLLKHGAHVNAKSAHQDTALHDAVMPLPGHAAIVRRLLDAGADLSARNSRAMTPLQEAEGYLDHQMYPAQDELRTIIDLLNSTSRDR